MSSIFDGLTVSAPALGVGDPPPSDNLAPPVQQTTMPSGLRNTIASPVAPPPQAIGSTGLMAKVEPEEFLKLVTETRAAVVLYTPQISPTAQRVAIDRYVACISGVIFVTLAAKVLRFPAGVQVVSASAVLCDNRPLSHQDTM